ncbi:MAG: hypothetical protein MdMp014T_2690 [Treponematales bacterium]
MTTDNFVSIKFRCLEPLKELAGSLKTTGDDGCVDERAELLKRYIDMFKGFCPDEVNPAGIEAMENAVSGMQKTMQENWGYDRFDFTDPLKRAYWQAIKYAGEALSVFRMDAQQARIEKRIDRVTRISILGSIASVVGVYLGLLGIGVPSDLLNIGICVFIAAVILIEFFYERGIKNRKKQ